MKQNKLKLPEKEISNLRVYFEVNGISFRSVAKKVGVSPSTFNVIMNDNNFPLKVLNGIYEGFDMPNELSFVQKYFKDTPYEKTPG